MYFEDFEPNQTLTTTSRRISAADLDDFIRLSGLDNPIFTSAEGARAAGHPDRIVPAPLQLSVAMGLGQKSGFFDHVVAVVQFDELRFLHTVHPGDALDLTAKVLSKKETSRTDRGLVVLEYSLNNQHGRPVMTARATYLMRRRPA